MGETSVLRGSTALRDISAQPVTTARPVRTIGRTVVLSDRPSAIRSIAREDVGPAPTTQRPGGAGRLTLTRRGRLLLVGLPVALGIGLLIFLGAFLTSKAQAGEGPAQSSPTISVTVGAGETLWGLASRHAPDRDPRDVVAEMVELNNLGSSVVQAGQSISIPTQG